MKGLRTALMLVLSQMAVLGLLTLPLQGADAEEFNSEKIISEIEKQMNLSREKWEKLKPLLEQKSTQLSQDLQGSIDKSFAELHEIARKLEEKSKGAEQQFKQLLTSEEAMALREQLAKIDKQAIDSAKDKMIADLNALLDLSEEQARKIRPVLEDSFTQIGEMMRQITAEGNRNWTTFKEEFEKLTREFHDKARDILDQKQMEKLEDYNERKKEEIERTLFKA